MPNLLFHQNMRIFGGRGGWGPGTRNTAYNTAFGFIQGGLPVVTQIDIAGFTEIMNSGASVAALNTLSNTLFGVGGGAQVYVVPCGMTALAAPPPAVFGSEYIGIAVRPGLGVHSLGRITFNARGHGLVLIHERIAAPAPGAVDWLLPEDATADYRGVVYVAVTIGPVNIAVGFLHNLYTFVDHRALVRQQFSVKDKIRVFTKSLEVLL